MENNLPISNEVIMINGYIGKDVTEIKLDKKKKEFCTISVAVSYHKNVHWYQVNVYGERARKLVETNGITKGKEIIVKGKPNFYAYMYNGKANIWAGIFVSAPDDWISIQEKLFTKAQKGDLEKANEIDRTIPDSEIEDLSNTPF